MTLIGPPTTDNQPLRKKVQPDHEVGEVHGQGRFDGVGPLGGEAQGPDDD